MPDTDDDLKKLTAGEPTAIIDELETHVDGTNNADNGKCRFPILPDVRPIFSSPLQAEDPNFAAKLARNLTNDSVGARRHPPASAHRALTADEARRHAEVTFFTDVHFGLKRGLKLCWDRLPDAQSAEVALSYQRLITEMTTLLAWTRWEEGRDVTTQLAARAAECEARYQEEKELDRWRKRGSGEDAAERGAALNPRTEFLVRYRAAKAAQAEAGKECG